jgi:hypothetical protein
MKDKNLDQKWWFSLDKDMRLYLLKFWMNKYIKTWKNFNDSISQCYEMFGKSIK